MEKPELPKLKVDKNKYKDYFKDRKYVNTKFFTDYHSLDAILTFFDHLGLENQIDSDKLAKYVEYKFEKKRENQDALDGKEWKKIIKKMIEDQEEIRQKKEKKKFKKQKKKQEKEQKKREAKLKSGKKGTKGDRVVVKSSNTQARTGATTISGTQPISGNYRANKVVSQTSRAAQDSKTVQRQPVTTTGSTGYQSSGGKKKIILRKSFELGAGLRRYYQSCRRY